MTADLPKVVIGFALALILLISGCRSASSEEAPQIISKLTGQEVINLPDKKPCIDYSNLNYTTLKISEQKFKNLSCYRQIDWLNGMCFPSACKVKNPPVCVSEYAIYCHDEGLEASKYFKYQRSGDEALT